MRRDAVDYFLVPDGQLEIHSKLEHWARWVRVRPHGWQVAPMFRQYRSKAWQWHRPEVKTPVNVQEAVQMEKSVSLLPAKNREAIRWVYVRCDSPVRMARTLGVSMAGLMELVCSGRQMLVNHTLK